ncbi:MAG TPA: response regulator, partial [Allocoleopsis sp.]
PESVSFRDGDDYDCWQYHALTIMLKRQRVNIETVKPFIASIIAEVLFDIKMQSLDEQLNFSIYQQKNPEPGIILFDVEAEFAQIELTYETWKNAGFEKISPHLTPIIKQPEILKQKTGAIAYKNFSNLLNGENTLRDLAIQMKQDILLITRSLIPYIRQGIVGLKEIPDLPPLITITPRREENQEETTKKETESELNNKNNETDAGQNAKESALVKLSPRLMIVCVDDSPQTCLMMENICQKAGYDFISIQDPIKALPILIELKPALIFVDLLMPVVNGYEIVAQLRRISIFTQTPIVILTSNTGIVDRVRAKMIGANDFISKPVEEDKILPVIQKYLSAPIALQNE